MHCARHVGDYRKHPCERGLCLALLCVISGIAISLAVVFLKRHLYRPTLTSIDRNYMNWGIVLPSLTLCEHEKLNETALEIYLASVKNSPNWINDDELQKRAGFLKRLVNSTIYNLDLLPNYPGIEANQYLKLMNQLTNFHSNIVIHSERNISIPLVRVVTEMGICWSFNSQLYPYTSVEYHLNDQIVKAPDLLEGIYPHGDNFLILLNLNGSSYDIYWHNPYDFPSADKVVHMDSEYPTYTSLVFKSFQLYCTDKVHRLLIYQRQCRFDDESNLDHFSYAYSYDVCRTECRIKKMLQLCGCIPFFYRAVDTDRYCTIHGLKCIAYYQVNIEKSRDCDCISRCEGVIYNLDSVEMLYWIGYSSVKWELATIKSRYRRDVIYGIEEVLIGLGVSAGLFLGLSALSFTEFFFFYFVHIYQFDRRRLNEW
ncbi:sodium channel protein Nach-like [Sergentomyia squamirostris]